MKNFALVAGLFMGLALSLFVSAPAQAENRPYGELNYLHQLNGEQTRATQADGGGLAMHTSDAGIGCASVPTGGAYEFHCNAAGHFCPWNDGGTAFCSSSIQLVTYGRPIAASSASSPAPFFYTAPAGTTGSTKSICITPASGATMTCAVFRLQ